MNSNRAAFLVGLTIILSIPAAGAEVPLATPEDVGVSSERLARISEALGRFIDKREVPGFVTLVARRGKIVHWEAYGQRAMDSDEPMPKDAFFDVASMTKAITVVSAMMLYEQGYYILSDPVSKYLPEFKNPRVQVVSGETVPSEREITVHDLLTHTSGIRDPLDRVEIFMYPTLSEHMKDLAKEPLRFHPGTQWLYGDSHDVLGYLVEVVSGQRLDRFWQEKIFEPLGMTDAYYWLPKDKEPRRAILLQDGKNDPEMKSRYPAVAAERKTYFRGAGGLHLTALDYWRLCQMLLNGGELNGVRLLSPRTIEWMTINHIGNLHANLLPPGARFGLGFYVVTDPGKNLGIKDSSPEKTYRPWDYLAPSTSGTYGWGGALGTVFWIDPAEELIGVLMAQVRPHQHLTFRQQFRALTYAAIIE